MIGIVVLCICALLGRSDASAIPMWEYLGKQEKMSFLYSLFANQVDAFCETSTTMDCNKQLLKFGLNTLKNMPEEKLDATDPYQRGSNDIIWETLLLDHPLAKTHPKHQSTSTTPKPNSYDDDESFGDDPFDDFNYQSAASAKIDNVYRVPPPKDFVYQMETGDPEYVYPHNVDTFVDAFDGPVMDKEAFKKLMDEPTSKKMSFLYSVFGNMVDDFCETSSMQNCNKSLLKQGLDVLKKMEEDLLDNMDPYQKNSHSIIWEKMLKDHPLSKSPPKEKPTSTTPAPNSYNDDKTLGDFGSEGAASSDLDNVYRVPPPKEFIEKIRNDTKASYPHNVATIIKNGETADDDSKNAFEQFGDQHIMTMMGSRTPLTGPVVTKVHLDGSPVLEEHPVHHDEDLKQHMWSQMPLPDY
ncbi:hypothetical protein NQ317_008231 [Molorchus minor]|uniref:Uncharacterized protein n=1 Tax=Molorchus minor TaxID=1323400 RepID=A0ABQ9J3W7_9CUCU|nr:hypothetical protein NQ317_008231 [Molorchus minor]